MEALISVYYGYSLFLRHNTTFRLHSTHTLSPANHHQQRSKPKAPQRAGVAGQVYYAKMFIYSVLKKHVHVVLEKPTTTINTEAEPEQPPHIPIHIRVRNCKRNL